MHIPPNLQAIIDEFEVAANAAVQRAHEAVINWRLINARIRYGKYSIECLESPDLETYMGVPISDLKSGKENWPE